MEFGKLVLEGDLETFINTIMGDNMQSSSSGHILQDIELMVSTFNNVYVCHVRRLGNCVAHRLA